MPSGTSRRRKRPPSSVISPLISAPAPASMSARSCEARAARTFGSASKNRSGDSRRPALMAASSRSKPPASGRSSTDTPA